MQAVGDAGRHERKAEGQGKQYTKTFFFFLLSSHHFLFVFVFGFGLVYLCLCVCVFVCFCISQTFPNIFGHMHIAWDIYPIFGAMHICMGYLPLPLWSPHKCQARLYSLYEIAASSFSLQLTQIGFEISPSYTAPSVVQCCTDWLYSGLQWAL